MAAVTAHGEGFEAVLKPLHVVGTRRDTREKLVGGKALRLAELARAGFPVSEGWVLDTKIFDEVVESALPRGYDLGALIKGADSKTGAERAARAHARVYEVDLPEKVSRALAELWDRYGASAPWGFAVRSSATVEDSDNASFAGIATSVLGVKSLARLEASVREVWASLYSPRTLAYLARFGVRDASMAVLIQRTVVAKAAGVFFTDAPTATITSMPGTKQRLVQAAFGLGAPVVDGVALCDTLTLDADGRVTSAILAHKTTALVVGEDGPTVVPVPEEDRDSPALSPRAVARLSRIVHDLELSGRTRLDIEFCVDRDSEDIVLLQVRPITGGAFPEGGDETTVWSRANVGEALPGAATPLTWSIARRFSEEGFRTAFEALGCKVGKNTVLVSSVYGRFYLNLTAFMKIASQVPGLSPRALLSLSGGADADIMRHLEEQIAHRHHRGFLMRMPFALPKLATRHIGLHREIDAFDADADRLVRHHREMDLGLLPDDALAQTLKQAYRFMATAGDLMLTAASASLGAHLLLVQLLARSRKRDARAADGSATTSEEGHEVAARLARALTGGIAEVESASPGLALGRLSAIARADAAARDILREGRANTLADLPNGPTRAAFLEFLERYGERTTHEAELAVPRWREDPRPIFDMVGAALKARDFDPEAGPMRARSQADLALATFEASASRTYVGVVRVVVQRAQHFTQQRERMRAWVTRALGLIRSICLEVDARLLRIEPSLPPGSVFFCTFDELLRALGSGRAEVGHIVRLRRAEYMRDRLRPDPPPAFVGRPPNVPPPPKGGKRLVGLAASGGVVEGRARILHARAIGDDADRKQQDLTSLEPGEILVARTTDVGLSPLFLVAAGIVTELGGPLSHAAIVAREYGVPAVVNVEGATLLLRTGDVIRVDGDRGTVEKIEKPDADDRSTTDSQRARTAP